MATQPEGGSRLWRGIQHLIFGDDAEPTLRGQIEEAIEEAEDSRPVAGDLSSSERQMLRNQIASWKLYVATVTGILEPG